METLWNILDGILDFITSAIIPIAGAVITYRQVSEEAMEKKIRNFKMLGEQSPTDRNSYAKKCVELYKKQYKKGLNGRKYSDMVFNNLIYMKNWLGWDDRLNDFVSLDKVKVNLNFSTDSDDEDKNNVYGKIVNDAWDKTPPKAKFLPYPKDGYALNLKYAADRNVSLYNGALFALDSAEGEVKFCETTNSIREQYEKPFTLNVKIGGYFDFLNTCECLLNEVYSTCEIKHKQFPNTLPKLSFLSNLPCRAKVRDIFDFSNRFAGIGINSATVFHNLLDENGNKKSYILFHNRTKNVVEGRGAVHVVPAGSYQPIVGLGAENQASINTDMKNTVYSEFAQELLGRKEVTYLNVENYKQDHNLNWDIQFLGIGIEPLNTKCEVLTSIIIDMDRFDNKQFFGTNTKEGLTKFFKACEEGTLLIEELNRFTLTKYLNDPRMTPAGKEIMSIMLKHENYFMNYIPGTEQTT